MIFLVGKSAISLFFLVSVWRSRSLGRHLDASIGVNMKLKNLMMALIAGLTLCGWASAATVLVDRHSANTVRSVPPAEPILKIDAIGATHFMPEVQVGDGSRPGIIQTDAEDSVLEDETLQDPAQE
jgi:hypothetical protein